MEETLFLYGSGRSAATRTQRFGKFPREQQTRVGPWIVRPSRSVAVRREILARYQEELILKVTNGTVQVKLKDGTEVPLQDIPALFADVAPDYSGMSEAELFDLLRGEAPSVAILRALMLKIPIEQRREAGNGLRSVIEQLAEKEHREFQKLIDDLDNEEHAYHEKVQVEEEERIQKEAAEQQARADADKAAADAAAKEAAQKASTLPAPAADGLDMMDFANKGETVVSEETKAQLESVVENMAADGLPKVEREAQVITSDDVGSLDEVLETPEQAAEADAKAVEGCVLPEGWRTWSNTKLSDLITEKGITMPEKKNKTGLIEALETWLAGG